MTYQEQLQKIKQQLDEAKRLNAESRLLLNELDNIRGD